MRLRLIILSTILFFTPNISFSQETTLLSSGKPFLIEGDYLAYSVEDNILIATGNIVALLGKIRINSDSLQLDINKRLLQAQGKVTISRDEISATDEKLDKIEELKLAGSSTSSIIQGDALRLDLNLMQGCVYKVEGVIEITYFIGEDLRIISSPLKEITTNIETPDLARSHLSLVAKRMKIVLGERMEAWKVSFWVRGIKTLSLPYYTSSVEESLERLPSLPFHIKIYHLDYSSKEGVGFKSNLYYSPAKKGFLGLLKLDYKSKYQRASGQKEEKWKANLEQNFSFGEKDYGVLRVSNLGERAFMSNLNYKHFFSQKIEASLGINYNRSQSLGFNINSSFRFADSDLILYQSWNKSLRDAKESEHFKIIYRLRPKFTEGTNIGYNTNLSLGYRYDTRRKDKVWDGNLGVYLYKSGIYLTHFSFLNLSGYFNETVIFPNQQSTALQGNVDLNLRFGRQNLFALNYSTSYQSRRDRGSFTFSQQGLGGSLNLGRKNIYRGQITTSYDLKKNRFYDINPNIEVRLNKLLRGSFQTSYQLKAKPEYKFFRFNLYYKLFGEGDNRRLQMQWEKTFTPKKEKFYWIGLSSMI